MPVMLSRHANLRLLNADHRRLTRAVQRRPILTRLQEYRSNHAATCRQLHGRHTEATSQRAVARQKIDGFNREIGETVCQIRTLHQPLTHLPRSLRGDRAPGRGTMPASRLILSKRVDRLVNDSTWSRSFGVLRYGETENFTEAQITALFDALQHLTEDDPYFLSRNRDDRTAAGSIIFPPKERIKSAIASADNIPDSWKAYLSSVGTGHH